MLKNWGTIAPWASGADKIWSTYCWFI